MEWFSKCRKFYRLIFWIIPCKSSCRKGQIDLIYSQTFKINVANWFDIPPSVKLFCKECYALAGPSYLPTVPSSEFIEVVPLKTAWHREAKTSGVVFQFNGGQTKINISPGSKLFLKLFFSVLFSQHFFGWRAPCVRIVVSYFWTSSTRFWTYLIFGNCFCSRIFRLKKDGAKANYNKFSLYIAVVSCCCAHLSNKNRFSIIFFLFLSLSLSLLVRWLCRVKLKNFLESPVMGNLSAGLGTTISRLVVGLNPRHLWVGFQPMRSKALNTLTLHPTFFCKLFCVHSSY